VLSVGEIFAIDAGFEIAWVFSLLCPIMVSPAASSIREA
jgi:hypothetical protein